MTENKIGLQAVLLDEQFQAGLKRYLAGLDAMDNATDDVQAGAKQMTKALGDIDKSVETTAKGNVEWAASIEIVEKAYAQAADLIRGGLGLAELGANFDRQQMRFEAFAAEAGGAAANLEAFQRGAGGTVNKMEAMTAASRLLQMGIVGNAVEMEKVVEAATRLGDQTASAGDRVNDFALMLANTSLPRLDAYGLSAGFVRERMKELQDTTEGMSREQAFAQAVFEASADSLDVLGERVEDNAAKMERAKARAEDLRIEWGQKLAGAAGTVAGAMADMESETLSLIVVLTGGIGIATKFAGGMGNLLTKMNLTGVQAGVLAAAIIALIGVYESARNVQEALVEGQEKVVESLSEWEQAAAAASAKGQDLSATADEMAAKVNAANQKLQESDNILDGAVKAFVRATSEEEIFGKAAEAARDAILSQTMSVEEGRGAINEYNESIINQKAAIVDVTEADLAMAAAQNQFNLATKNGTEITREAVAAYREQIAAQGELGGILGTLQGMADRAIETSIRSNELEEAHVEFLDGAADSTEKFTQAQGRRVAGQQTANEATNEDVLALREARRAREDIAEATVEFNKALEEETKRQEEATQAAQDHTVALLNQAEALSDADAAEAAGAAIDGLNQLLDAGAISLEEYQALVRGVQDDYGLVNDEGRALAEGIDNLNTGLASGALTMDEYREQLDALIGAQVGSLEATKAQAEAQKELVKEQEKAAKEAEKEAERIQKKAERDAERAQKKALKDAERERKKLEKEAERAKEKAEREAKKLAEKIRREVEREMEAAAKAAEELPGKLFDALSGLGSTALKTLKDELEPLDEELKTIDDALEQWKRALEDPTADLEDQQNSLAAIAELEAERAAIAAERAEQEARIAEFQQAQQQMALLQQQLDLMELVQEHGLDAQQVLGGLTADASASDIIEATTAAMQQIIEQTRAGIGAGGMSPTATMTQAPAFAPPTIAGGDTNTQNTFDLGGNSINTGMDMAQFEAMIRRVLAESVNG